MRPAVTLAPARCIEARLASNIRSFEVLTLPLVGFRVDLLRAEAAVLGSLPSHEFPSYDSEYEESFNSTAPQRKLQPPSIKVNALPPRDLLLGAAGY